MDDKDHAENAPLIEDEDFTQSPSTTGNTYRKPSRGRLEICLWLLVLELANILFFVGGPAIVANIRKLNYHQHDDYDALTAFNKVWVYEPLHNFSTGIFSDEDWLDSATHTGIVSMSEEWVTQHGILKSISTPGRPGEMVYQVDMFHNMHCLSRMRKIWQLGLVSPEDKHTLHCIDYLRRTVMCNIDTALGATATFEDFGIHDAQTHKCRDYDAVVRWAENNKWEGFMEYHLLHGDPDPEGLSALIDKAP